MLRDLLRKEIGSSKPVDLTKDELESITEEVSQTIAWCSNNPIPDTCLNLYKALEKAFKGLARDRFIKSIGQYSEESLESKLFKTADDLLIKYYRILMSGLATPELEVPVVINKSVEIKGKIRGRGIVTYLHLLEAILMKNLGFVDILVPL